jgi:hypothetical protein
VNAPPQPVEEAEAADAAAFAAIVAAARPAVLRGAVAHWPAVAAAAGGGAPAAAYLARFDRGAGAEAFVAPPEAGGRFFYDAALSGFNFERRPGAFASIVTAIAGLEGRADPPSIYVGAAPVPEVVPGFERENPLPLLDGLPAVPRIWIGNASIVSAHFDESDNLACVVAGRRRFTLFPPEQVANLYVGPLDFTMAGQPTSMVDLRAPDFERYPRFRDALAAALTVELEPGDALFVPALWWHNVEAASPFNILVNHWWRATPEDAGSPFLALVHAILSVSSLPEAQRRGWRAHFDQFVFRDGDADPAAHLPAARRGILGAPTPALRRRIRHFILAMLGRLE